MPFFGRKREIAAITAALGKDKSVILTGKYGIGKTTLVKEVAKKHGERWRFLFADFSKTPSNTCNELLVGLKPKRSQRERASYLGYKQSRSLLVDTALKTSIRYVIVLDNIEKLTPQKLGLIRYLEKDQLFLFIALPERFLAEEELLDLRVCLYPTRVIKLRYLSADQTAGFFRYYADKHRLSWTESDIHMFILATRGYPPAMKELVNREIERQK